MIRTRGLLSIIFLIHCFKVDSLEDGTQNRLVVKGRTSALAGVDNFVSSPIYNGGEFQ